MLSYDPQPLVALVRRLTLSRFARITERHIHKCALPVKSEKGILDLVQLVPLKPGHLGVMAIPVVVAAASLCILIACSSKRHNRVS